MRGKRGRTRPKEYKKDLISSFDEARSFPFLFHFHFFSISRERIKKFTFGRIEGK